MTIPSHQLIARYVVIGFAIMVSLVFVLSLLAIYKLRETYQGSEEVRVSIYRTYNDLNVIRAGVGNLRRYEKDTYLNISDPLVYQSYKEKWEQEFKHTAAAIDDLSVIPKDVGLLETIESGFQQGMHHYHEGYQRIYQKIIDGQIRTPEEGNRAMLRYKHHVRQLDTSIQYIIHFLQNSEHEVARQAQKHHNRMMAFVLSLSCLVIFIGIYIAYKVFKATSHVAQILNYQATHDSLTKLLNCSGFQQEVKEKHKKCYKGSIAALMYLDLDQFKVVDDVCGHIIGDEMLARLCQAFSGSLPKETVVGRVRSDEFVFYAIAPSEAELHEQAASILRSIREFRFTWKGRSLTVSGSMGIKILYNGYFEFNSALDLANAACFVAKDRGRDQVYTLGRGDRWVQHIKEQKDWAARVTQLIESDELTLYYQRITALQYTPKERSHCEVLLRARIADGCESLPANLIPAAERFSMMQQLDRWVVKKTIENMASNGRLSQFDMVSINLSGDSLKNRDFAVFILDQLERFNIKGHQLCFEITETAAIGNFDNARHIIMDLKASGCRFSLDDFGTGLSSFGYIKKLPVDYLKIDGVFIKNLVHDMVDVTLVNSLVTVAKSLKIQTIAEFVENGETASLLASMEIDFAQGYHFHQPESVF